VDIKRSLCLTFTLFFGFVFANSWSQNANKSYTFSFRFCFAERELSYVSSSSGALATLWHESVHCVALRMMFEKVRNLFVFILNTPKVFKSSSNTYFWCIKQWQLYFTTFNYLKVLKFPYLQWHFGFRISLVLYLTLFVPVMKHFFSVQSLSFKHFWIQRLAKSRTDQKYALQHLLHTCQGVNESQVYAICL